MDEIYVYFTELPEGIEEMVTPCYDGYTIYIDRRLSDEKIKGSFIHALYHIANRDFDKENVDTIEKSAHEG